jgi:predicted ferric reductase
MNGQFWWYVTRATGLVAWALLGLSTATGLLLSARRTVGRRPVWFVDLHRGLSGLGCLFVAAHLAAILADSFEHFGPLDLVVPMRTSLSPGAVTWGIVALYLLVAVEASSLAVRRLPYRVWRRVHYASLAIFWLTTLHAFLVGTDATNRALLAAGAASIAGCALLTFRRLMTPRGRSQPILVLPLDEATTEPGHDGLT